MDLSAYPREIRDRILDQLVHVERPVQIQSNIGLCSRSLDNVALRRPGEVVHRESLRVPLLRRVGFVFCFPPIDQARNVLERVLCHSLLVDLHG